MDANDWYVAIKKLSASNRSHWYMEILTWEILLVGWLPNLYGLKAGELLSSFSSQEGL